jgi:hypothetical protein
MGRALARIPRLTAIAAKSTREPPCMQLLVTGNREHGHVPRSGNVRSVPGTWEQSRSRSVKT